RDGRGLLCGFLRRTVPYGGGGQRFVSGLRPNPEEQCRTKVAGNASSRAYARTPKNSAARRRRATRRLGLTPEPRRTVPHEGGGQRFVSGLRPNPEEQCRTKVAGNASSRAYALAQR